MSNDAETAPVKVSQTIIDQMHRRGMITHVRSDDPHCKPHVFDAFDRAHAIALIAHNFDDHPPNTPEREALFGTKLDDRETGA